MILSQVGRNRYLLWHAITHIKQVPDYNFQPLISMKINHILDDQHPTVLQTSK